MRSLRLLIGTVLVIVLGVALWGLGSQSSDTVSGQAYPGPGTATSTSTFTAVPSATPTPDMDGYLPVPSGMVHQVDTLAGSSKASLLVPLQQELTNQEAAALAARAYSRIPLRRVGGDDESGYSLTRPLAEWLLEKFFSQGDTPVVQAYFEDEDGSCIVALTYRYSAPMMHGLPTDPPPPTDVPSLGLPFPDTFESNAAAWKVCQAENGRWWWKEWAYGNYYETLDHYYGDLSVLNEWSLHVIRP